MNSDKKIPIKIRVASFVSVVLLLAVDQIIKYYVDLRLKGQPPFVLLKGVLQLNYLENDGAMMGLMSGKTEIMTVLAVACVIAMLFVVFSGIIKDRFDYFCTLLMIAGGLGNIIDRVFRGYVIDYIEVLFVDFYIFNFVY